jgi:glutamyl-Q tRNA(Asp) synthetase
MASYLDARAAEGSWLIRMEDLDTPRMVKGAAQTIIDQLATLGMQSHVPVLYQSDRLGAYQAAFESLQTKDLIYPCGCTRQEILDSVGADPTNTAHTKPYPGTCRHGLPSNREARAWRFIVPNQTVVFNDRWCGQQTQNVSEEVGDFVLKRADGIWSYQLAVVVDDAFQGVTDIVRGQDLLDSTARQYVLANALGLNSPKSMHVPVLYDEFGLKLSKQNHAQALNLVQPLECLMSAWLSLGFAPLAVNNVATFWCEAMRIWQNRFT